jgi:predicted DNA-binding protein with PD1-like motif
MKYSEAKQGRVFIMRLEDGDIIHEEIEKFAVEKNIKCAHLTILGGIDKGSKLVCGPQDGRAKEIVPGTVSIDNVHEITGTGTIFPDKDGIPSLHMHIACGREEKTITGCIRTGVKTWHVLEVVLVELLECSAKRLKDEATGFNLLVP